LGGNSQRHNTLYDYQQSVADIPGMTRFNFIAGAPSVSGALVVYSRRQITDAGARVSLYERRTPSRAMITYSGFSTPRRNI
jgi:hypothetical protein